MIEGMRARQFHEQVQFRATVPEKIPRAFVAVEHELAKLHEVGACSQNHLGRLIYLDAATIKGVVDRLDLRGFLTALNDPKDRRRRAVALTDRGRQVTEAAMLVAADMERVNATILSRTGSEVTMIPEVANHLISSGGKRLRPMLTLAMAQLAGYGGDGHIKLAAAVEFMHTATLLHDDVVDESDLRRGRSTANAARCSSSSSTTRRSGVPQRACCISSCG